jgi:hypothetical protein
MNHNNFSYDFYKNLLEDLLSSRDNLCIKDLSDPCIERDFLVLRHDVDFSPEAALQMAELEASMDVKATYYLLFSSSYYNLISEEYIQFPKKLAELGHEVGLHYDVNILEMIGNDDLIGVVKLQSNFLSELAGSEVKSIAMHNPSIYGIDPFKETKFNAAKLINAYNNHYTDKIAYFSDSCGAWRDDFVECLNKKGFPAQMQLVIHPIFWGTNSLTRWKSLDDLIENRISFLLDDIKKVRELWRNHTGLIQHDNRNNDQVDV